MNLLLLTLLLLFWIDKQIKNGRVAKWIRLEMLRCIPISVVGVCGVMR